MDCNEMQLGRLTILCGDDDAKAHVATEKYRMVANNGGNWIRDSFYSNCRLLLKASGIPKYLYLEDKDFLKCARKYLSGILDNPKDIAPARIKDTCLSFFEDNLLKMLEAGDYIVFINPENGLHPRRQRIAARLFAYLVNKGVNIILVTNSDYIVKELNTLIMIDFDKKSRGLGTKRGYKNEEFLKASDVKAYEVNSDMTVRESPVSQDAGMAVESMDKEIKDMGVFQRELLYGD